MLSVAKTGFLVGYARVSTEDQSLALQIDALKRVGVLPDNMHVEKVSGSSQKRPALDFAIKDLREGDTLVVWRLDRLARSMRQLYERLGQIYGKGAKFRSLTEDFDFNTITGKLIIAVLGAIAEFERQIIAQRTKAGIDAIRRRKGKHWKWGPPVYMTPERIRQVGTLLHKGMSGPEVARQLHISTASVYAHWKQIGKNKWKRKLPSRKPHKD
jgi:DNA invertase Pin-like site-specific DNA recombinase